MVAWFQMPGRRKHLSWSDLIIDSLLIITFWQISCLQPQAYHIAGYIPIIYIYYILISPQCPHKMMANPPWYIIIPLFLGYMPHESPWYLLVSIEYPLWFLCLGYPPANEHVEKPPSIIFQGKPRKLLSKMVIRQLNVACSKIYVNCMLQ